jgi:hypothetical protein
MKVQFLQDWHCGPGNTRVVTGQICDARDVPWPLPWNAVKALDQQALDALCFWCGEENYHLLQRNADLTPNPIGYPPPAPERRRYDQL